jgi:RluA family pseudouridine synthase
LILYHDNHLLVVNKPAGRLVQGDQTGRETLLDDAKAWIKQEYDKPGNVFLGLVHRLDRPASGVIVFARTSKAASRLSEEFRSRRPRKTYWALVEGEAPGAGEWTDHLLREEYNSRVVDAPLGKEARLSFTRLSHKNVISHVEVDLQTGRHHQIRVQFAHRGHPVLGDTRYGSSTAFHDDAIALHARELTIVHPTKKEEMTFTADVSTSWSGFLDG